MNHPRMKLTTLLVLAMFVLFPAPLALSGSLDPSGAPAPTMKTLQEIYDKLELIDNKVEPQGFVWIPRTGQNATVPLNPAPAGSDGDLRKGMAWPVPRFTDSGNGTVLDNLTELVWLKNANCEGIKNWADALTFANGLDATKCGLSDGSAAGDWRLPNIRELLSLIDYSRGNAETPPVHPALPSGHPFEFPGPPAFYWSSTTLNRTTGNAWQVNFHTGEPDHQTKEGTRYVWPVRDGP